MRVLVIEDDAGIRANVLDLLDAEGFEGEGAADGEAGVAAALARTPDLVVCDISMPKLDGYGVLDRLRKTPHLGGVPFVFLTARADASDIRQGMRRGADDYLTKPFQQVELLEVIRARLARHQATAVQLERRATLDVSPSRPRELSVLESEPATTARYLVEQLLGEGGMGAVYRALDRKLQRRVALKVLHRELAETEEGRERLLREARAAARLHHVNAVSIYDVGETADGPFLAMELVSGRTLRSYVEAAVPQGTRIRWLVETARALSAAHAVGLVHRDVKPENVMVSDEGVVKVLDFGIARRAAGFASLDGPASTTAPTGTQIEGTPFYMAPEQLMGNPVDASADQFAWGVVAFELLAGRLPWSTGGSAVAQMSAMLAEDAPTLASLGIETPPGVSAAIARALARDPSARLASMDLVIAALEPFADAVERPTPGLEGAPTQRLPPASDDPASTPDPVRVNATTLVSPAGAARAASRGVARPADAPPREPAPIAPAEARGRTGLVVLALALALIAAVGATLLLR